MHLWFDLDKNGKIINVSEEKSSGNVLNLDEVIVIALKKNHKKDEIADNSKPSGLLTGEVNKVVKQLPKIDIQEFQGKTIGLTIKFILQ